MELLVKKGETSFEVGLKQFVLLAVIILTISIFFLFFLREKGTISFSPDELCSNYYVQATNLVLEVNSLCQSCGVDSDIILEEKIKIMAESLCKKDLNQLCPCEYS